MRACSAFLATFLLLACGLMFALYAFDPLQLFHDAWWRTPALSTAMRYQAAGILRRESYTGIILGNSYMENTSALQASREIGGRFLNVSIGASTDVERELALHLALTRPELTDVIYQLGFDTGPNPLLDFSTWKYLYAPGLGKLRFYLREDYLRCMLKWSVQGCIPDFPFSEIDLENLVAWDKNKLYAVRFGGVQHWIDDYEDEHVKEGIDLFIERIDHPPPPYHEPTSEAIRRRICTQFKNVVLPSLKQRPDVRFSLVIPPYSRAYWSQLSTSDSEAYLGWQQCVVEDTAALHNVTIYGFENDDYADIIGHYKDFKHFGPDMNERFIHAIASGTNILSERNIDSYLNDVRGRYRAFDTDGLARTIRALLQERRQTEGR